MGSSTGAAGGTASSTVIHAQRAANSVAWSGMGSGGKAQSKMVLHNNKNEEIKRDTEKEWMFKRIVGDSMKTSDNTMCACCLAYSRQARGKPASRLILNFLGNLQEPFLLNSDAFQWQWLISPENK
jgi:hypothetical protein